MVMTYVLNCRLLGNEECVAGSGAVLERLWRRREAQTRSGLSARTFEPHYWLNWQSRYGSITLDRKEAVREFRSRRPGRASQGTAASLLAAAPEQEREGRARHSGATVAPTRNLRLDSRLARE